MVLISMTVRRAPRGQDRRRWASDHPGLGVALNARGPDVLVNGKPPVQPSKLNDLQRQAVADMIECGPIPAVHAVVRWRLLDLAQWIFEEFRITTPNRRPAGSYAPWATANSRPGSSHSRRRCELR